MQQCPDLCLATTYENGVFQNFRGRLAQLHEIFIQRLNFLDT